MTDKSQKHEIDKVKDAMRASLEKQRKAEGIVYDEFELSEQHNSNAGGFNDLTKAYKADATIENYVQMRRENPGKLIEVATSWSLDWLFANHETLEAHGIDPQTMAGALDADPACISEVSLRLLECLIERKAREASGRTHLQSRGEAIGDSLVNYLVAMMLDALDWNDHLYIPRDLIVLIRYQLGADESAEARAMHVHHQRQSAISIAAQLRYQGQSGSIRQVAKALNVNPSTVARWFTEEEPFEEEVGRWLELLNSDLMADFRKRLDEANK